MGVSSESDDGSDAAPAEFHVSMSNFILGKNPVVIADFGQENENQSSEEDSSVGTSQEILESTSGDTSGDTSGESSDVISAESSEISGSDVDVILIPVEAASEDITETELVECEKKKNKKKKCQNGHGCDKTAAGGEGSKSSPPDQKKSKRKSKGQHILEESSSKESTEGEESADTAATKTTNFNKSHEDSSESAPADTASSATSNNTEQESWSISEDALLRSMKEGGETWAEIAMAMQRSRSDVKARWKVVEKQPRVESDDADDELEKKGKPKKAQAQGKKEGAKSVKEATKSNEKAKQEKSTKPTKEENTKECQKKQKQEQKNVSKTMESSSSGASASTTTSVNEEEEQDSYLRKDIYSALYPNRMTLEPDTALSPTDCEVLASADVRRHAGRWLEMQANFYNTTGRWIPLHIIQQKCQGAEREQLKKVMSENGQDDELTDKVWSWIQGLKD